MNTPQYTRLNWSLAVSLLVLLLGLSMTYHLFHNAKIEHEQKARAYFDFRDREVINLITQRMRTYEGVLRGAAGLFAASVSVERNEFKEYISRLNLASEFPGIQGVGVSLIIPTANKSEHIASVRQEGFPDYAIQPSDQRDFYTSILFIEPFSDRNLRAFGYDMFTEKVRRAAMQKAIDTGKVTVSAKVKLVQETGTQEQAGFLMYLPIYRNGSEYTALATRRKDALGWVYAPFRMKDLMQGLYGEHATDLDIHIYDGTELSPQSLMYDSNVSKPHITKLNTTNRIQIGDHVWTVQIHALPLLDSRVETSYTNTIFVIGVVFSTLLSLVLWFLMTGRERAIHAASVMNRELIIERQRLSGIIEGMYVGTWEWNVQTGEAFFNQQWASFIGYELSELEPISIETWFKFVHPDDGKLSATLLEKHFSGELAYYECEARMQHKDGHWIWILDRGKVLTWTPDGKPCLMAGTHQEITERKRIENEVKIAATVFESQEGMLVTDAETIILRVNRAFTDITGYSADDVIGQTTRLFGSGRHDKTFYTNMWASLHNTGKWDGEIWNRRKNGEIYPEYLTIAAVKNATNVVTNYVATFTDITLRKAAAEIIENLAFYDPLTNLPNRRLLVDRLSRAIASGKRNNSCGALMFLDLDNFKPLNDTHGHVVGDMLLIEAAKRLRSCMRDMDTVARFGGDEFVVMLAELDSDLALATTQALIVAEKIRAVLSAPYVFTVADETQANTSVEHRCTASIGVAMFSADESNQDEIMKWADLAMYEAKDAGRNQVRIYKSQI